MKKIISILCCLSLLASSPLLAEGMRVTGGLMTKNIAVKKGYGAFLKDRFGQESLNLNGSTMAIGFPFLGGDWFLEQSKVSASPTYTSLSGDEKSFDMSLATNLIGFTFGSGENWKYALGYGMDTLTRNIEGYQSTSIQVDNLGNNKLAAESTNTGSHFMLQAMYTVFGQGFTGETGLRYDSGKILIPASDVRPELNSIGVPIDSELDLTGLDFLFTLTYRF